MNKVFLSNVFEFLKLSSGLSIESKHEIKWSKMTRWNGTEEFWKKKKSGNGKWLFCLFTFDCRADIITRYNFDLIRLDAFLTFNIDFMV